MHSWASPAVGSRTRARAFGRLSINGTRRSRSGLGLCASCVALVTGLSQPTHALELRAEAVEAFERYVDRADAEFESRLRGALPFLWSTETASRTTILRRGDIVVEPAVEADRNAGRGGLIHDWTGAVLIPGTTVERVVGVVTAYDTHAKTYAFLVLRSEILERDGPRLRVSMRLLRKHIVKVVLDTELLAEYRRLDERRWWCRSHSTRIREVSRPGTARESFKPVGNDRGFMWRLKTYWRFAQTETGVIAEYRSITLTRSIPKVFRRMLRSILNAFPRQSLHAILRTTREAALADSP